MNGNVVDLIDPQYGLISCLGFESKPLIPLDCNDVVHAREGVKRVWHLLRCPYSKPRPPLVTVGTAYDAILNVQKRRLLVRPKLAM